MGSITTTKTEARARLSSLRLGLAALARLRRTLTHEERELHRTLADNEEFLLCMAARRWFDWNPDVEYVGAFSRERGGQNEAP
jgi:hypothetical protein